MHFKKLAAVAASLLLSLGLSLPAQQAHAEAQKTKYPIWLCPVSPVVAAH